MTQISRVFNALSSTRQSQAHFAAVGMFAGSASNFCKGSFAAISNPAWMTAWGVSQRDSVVLYKDCNGDWKVYCTFSMNSASQSDFAAIVDAAFSLAEGCSSSPPSTPSSPSPSPGSGTAAADAVVIQHEVTLSGLSLANWTTEARSVYERGYGLSIGIYNANTNVWLTGSAVSAQATAAARRSGLNVRYSASVPPTQADAVATAAQQLTAQTLASSIATASSGTAVAPPSVSSMTVGAVSVQHPATSAATDIGVAYTTLASSVALVVMSLANQ